MQQGNICVMCYVLLQITRLRGFQCSFIKFLFYVYIPDLHHLIAGRLSGSPDSSYPGIIKSADDWLRHPEDCQNHRWTAPAPGKANNAESKENMAVRPYKLS